MFRFYKTSILVFIIIGFVIIIGSVIFSFYFDTGLIFVVFGLLASVLCFLFPILLYYRQLTYVVFENDKCISYSFFHRKLCTVDLRDNIFYSFFYVRFMYMPSIQFIALSNEPLTDNQTSKKLTGKSFFGEYNQKKIIIFPEEDRRRLSILTDQINQGTENTGDGSVC